MGHRHRLAAVLLLALGLGTHTAVLADAASQVIGPDVDWCAMANALDPGDELELAPGAYSGPCTLARGGTPGAPVVIRASDPANPPHLAFHGPKDNVINVTAGLVILRSLRFGPTLPNVDAVRIRAGDDVVIEDCVFEEIGGMAVVSNHSIRRVTIRNNEVIRSKTTAIDLGCRDGGGCRVLDALIEGNSIQGVMGPAWEAGYGVQIQLNSTAVIQANVIADTRGPGIMVYGAHSPLVRSVVERNLVMTSRQSPGIVVGGGPVIVRNNIVVGSDKAGIALENYQGRGLLRRVVVANNTVYASRGAGISVPSEGRLEASVLYNAVHTLSGLAFPASQPGLVVLGNVDCRPGTCFADPFTMNFAPAAGSPLIGRSPTGTDGAAQDFFGRRRLPIGSAGAVEAGATVPVTKRSGVGPR